MPPTTYNTAKYIFFHICIYSNCCFLCVAIKIAVFAYLLGSFKSFWTLTKMFQSLRTDDKISKKIFLISQFFMLPYNLKYLLVHLSRNAFKTLIIFQFPFATGHKMFKALRDSLLMQVFMYSPCPVVFCIKCALENLAKFIPNTEGQIFFLTRLQNFSLQLQEKRDPDKDVFL